MQAATGGYLVVASYDVLVSSFTNSLIFRSFMYFLSGTTTH